MNMATQPITITIEESTKARVIQAGKKDGRSMSNMANKLLELGLKVFWDGFEPVISDHKAYLEENKEK
jgi:hypothetical protein